MRCRACNSILSEAELIYKNPHTYEFEDMCFECLGFSDSNYSDLDINNYSEVEDGDIS